MKALIIFSLAILFLALTGCESGTDNQDEEPQVVELVAAEKQYLSVNDFYVELTSRGELLNGNLLKEEGGAISVLYMSGLWIGAEINGSPRGNIIYTKMPSSNNYISEWDGSPVGVFSLSSEIEYLADSWPVSLGAPVDASGKPKIYGDGMCWTVLHSDTTITDPLCYASPIKNLRVTQAVYGYNSDELDNVIFIKYSITNLSDADWDNVYTGFFSDTDLSPIANNQTGYDQARGLSITYEWLENNASGIAFLQTPKNRELESHRIMRKNDYYDPDFGEYSFETPEQIIYALTGLSNSGEPMINPITNQETKFAFTGDPVTQTGWVDTPVDVRSLLSTKSFSLKAGETVWLTLAICAARRGTSLESSINNVKETIDQVRGNATLWDFN